MFRKALNNIDIQRRALNAASLRQDVLANNIANVETPNFKRKDVVFEDILNEHMSMNTMPMVTTDERHFNVAINEGYVVSTTNSFEMRIDGNNVNPDYEMAELAKNQIKYNAMASAVNSQFKRLKAAIRGGR